MTQVAFGPVNITYGNAMDFVARFRDHDGNLTVPSGATLSVSYTNISNAPQTDTVTLTLNNSFFQGRWSSTNAAEGLASWTVTASSALLPFQIGVMRVLQNTVSASLPSSLPPPAVTAAFQVDAFQNDAFQT